MPRNDKNGAVLFDLDGVLVDSRESLIEKALGERGSVTLGLPGERLPSPPGAPRYVVTGLAVCNEPAEEMLAAIRRALVDYDVEERPAPMASTKIVVRPRERLGNRRSRSARFGDHLVGAFGAGNTEARGL